MAGYVYVVDAFINDPKYRTDVVRIESRISSLGLQGRWERMTILKNIHDTTEEAIKRGAGTVVIVGNDETVTKVLPSVVDHDVAMAMIPLGPGQAVAQALGLPMGVAACDCLSRRIIQHVDIGRANKHYFLLSLSAPAPTAITCDNSYTVTSLDPSGQILINNLGSVGGGRPNDGRLELMVQSGQGGRRSWWRSGGHTASIFPIHEAKVQGRGEQESVVLDGQTIVKPPLTVDVLPKKLSVIVGPERTF